MEYTPDGHYIVVDPKICHGEPTFRGTRIFVADVLEQVASGMAWETIIDEWRGSISEDAIAEAVRLARAAYLDRARRYLAGRTPACMSWTRTLSNRSASVCAAGAFALVRLESR